MPKHDVGANFLEHLVQLNELLIDLWVTGQRCPRADHPMFRWIPSDRVRLAWGEWVMSQGRKQQRVIQPDAVLEVPKERRRYFLECEMGTQLIHPGEANAPGATLSKADRYQTVLTDLSGTGGRQTHYQAQYPDSFTPEVLFLVLTENRALAVNTALAQWRTKLGGLRQCAIRAMTFDAATIEFRKFSAQAPEKDARAHLGPPPVGLISAADAEVLRLFILDALRSLKRARAVFREMARVDLPEYPTSYEGAWAILQRVVSETARPSRRTPSSSH
jgi:hypothetical protein